MATTDIRTVKALDEIEADVMEAWHLALTARSARRRLYWRKVAHWLGRMADAVAESAETQTVH